MSTSRVSGLRDHVGFWLRFVSNHVSQEFDRKVRREGISVPEWVVLRELYDLEVASMGTIGRMTGMTKGALSKLTTRLVRKKLVTATGAAADRRAREVRLTEAGERLVPVLARLADQNDREFFNRLTAAERRELKRMLRKIVTAKELTQVPTR